MEKIYKRITKQVRERQKEKAREERTFFTNKNAGGGWWR